MTTSASTSKLYAYNTSMGNSKFNVSDASTLYFSRLFKGSKKKTWFELSRVKLYRNDLRGNKNYFELAGGSSYRGLNYSKCMTEIQGKSVLVRRVSARLELASSSYRESTV